MTKIDIVSGFLGAGKTTLIKKLLADEFAGQQVVLIENEFGEIGIDGGFLKEAGIEIREMNSGCICCSLVGDFGKALKEVIDTYHPDRIIIEPSGVGKLSHVIKAVEDVDADDIVLNSFTTVADVTKCKLYIKNFGEFFNNQLQFARTIVLSRTDTAKATEEKVEEIVGMIRAINPNAAIITTPVEKLDSAVVLEAMEKGREDDDDLVALAKEEAAKHHHHHHHDHDHDEHDHEHHHDHDHDEHDHEHHHDHDHDEHDHEHHHDHDHEEHDHECGCGHHHHHHDGECGCDHDHDADEIFTSWGGETARKYTKDEIETILKTLTDDEGYGIILRAKGWVDSGDGEWIYFDMVPEEYEIRSGAPQITGKFCVIGSELNEEKLADLFKRA